jgi:hypothetical protein
MVEKSIPQSEENISIKSPELSVKNRASTAPEHNKERRKLNRLLLQTIKTSMVPESSSVLPTSEEGASSEAAPLPTDREAAGFQVTITRLTQMIEQNFADKFKNHQYGRDVTQLENDLNAALAAQEIKDIRLVSEGRTITLMADGGRDNDPFAHYMTITLGDKDILWSAESYNPNVTYYNSVTETGLGLTGDARKRVTDVLTKFGFEPLSKEQMLRGENKDMLREVIDLAKEYDALSNELNNRHRMYITQLKANFSSETNPSLDRAETLAKLNSSMTYDVQKIEGPTPHIEVSTRDERGERKVFLKVLPLENKGSSSENFTKIELESDLMVAIKVRMTDLVEKARADVAKTT